MKGQTIYAYVRVSSDKQNEARQLQELLELGIPKKNIIVEKISGKGFNRQKYNNLIKLLKKDDLLYISSVDRLGRDYDGIITEWSRLTSKLYINIKVIDSPVLNTDIKPSTLVEKYLKNITLHTLAFQAEQEWQNIKSRQKAGIAIAKEKGKHLGRPKTAYSDIEMQVIKQWQSGLLSLTEAMQLVGRKKSSFYRLVQELK